MIELSLFGKKQISKDEKKYRRALTEVNIALLSRKIDLIEAEKDHKKTPCDQSIARINTLHAEISAFEEVINIFNKNLKK